MKRIEIFPPSTNITAEKRLQSMINLFRWGCLENPKDIELERLKDPVDLSPDWLPPVRRLLTIEEETGRIIKGLDQLVDDDGVAHHFVAWPLVQVENESSDHSDLRSEQ